MINSKEKQTLSRSNGEQLPESKYITPPHHENTLKPNFFIHR